jgi:hypothetical protein
MTEAELYRFIAQSKLGVLSIPMEAKRRTVDDLSGRILSRVWHKNGHSFW